MSTKQLYEKTSEGMKEVSPLVSIEDIYSKLSDTPLEALVSLFNHVKCEWKGNVSDTRRTVPLFLRRSGLFITYNNGTKYITEFFSAGTDQITTEGWAKDSNWTSVPDEDYISAGVKPGVGTIGYEQLNDNLKQLFREKVNVTNFPDDEDIASVDNMLKFKDREADAANFQSKGYVILRKNLRLVNGVVKNILTQNMINQPNTIYEIRYDFDLDGATLEIYNGCILEFKGGKLKNGTLKGKNTQLNAAPSLIFNNVTFNGRWRIYNYFPEWFISDFSDCTDGIQQAIDFASINNGGKIVFLSRQYNVKSIHTGIKTNLIGSGIGATIIKQIEGTNKSLIDLPASSAGILIANMTLKGNNEAGCHGISKVEKSSGGENHEYIYSEVTSYDKQIAFRWSTFRNLAIYNFDRGIYITNNFFDFYIEKCSIGYNNIGVVFDCTDSSICNTYIFKNRESGLYLSGSNNRVINIKSIFNGRREGVDNGDAAFYVTGDRNTLVCCESQDNFCSGFIVKGYQNIFSACISNTDGYKYIDDNSYEHKPDYDANKCGFVCNYGRTNNIFSGCLVTTYLNECAISANLLSQDAAFEGIDCIAGNGTYLEFKEIPYNYIHHNNCALFNYTLSDDSKKLTASTWDGIDVALDKPININNITIAIVFNVGNDYNRNDGRLLKIGNGYELVVTNISEKDGYAYLVLKQVKADNKYNITCVIQKEKEIKAFISLTQNVYSLSLETHTDKGLMYFNKHIDLEYRELCSFLTLLYYCPSIRISKFVISKEGYRTADALQNVSLSRYYKNAIVAIDAEAALFDNYLKKGSTEKRPTLKSSNKGFVYFDTTLNKNITWNGWIWIDENGNPADAKKQGTTEERPSNVQIGYIYKDTSLDKLILWNGTAWVNLDGTELSQ